MNDCAEKGNLDLNTFNKQIPNPEAHINTRNINTNKKNETQINTSTPTVNLQQSEALLGASKGGGVVVANPQQ